MLSLLSILVLIVFSAFFSASENALNTVSSVRLKNKAKEGNRRASGALRLVEDYDRTLSTILVGNNLVNIASSALCTMLFTQMFGSAGAGYATLVMTVFILLCGEITPKSYAKEHADSLSLKVTPILSAVKWVLTPVNFLFMKWRGLMDRMSRAEKGPAITEDELMVMVEEIEKEGTLEKDESRLIQSAIEFDDISIREILTPRVDVAMVEDTAAPQEIISVFRESRHSRLPVYHETVDPVVGFLYEKDFYHAYLDDPQVSVKTVMRKVLFVPETMKISTLLSALQKAKGHLAVVVDQHGGMAGIVTMEDVLEQLVGEIWDESDSEVIAVRKTGENEYLAQGATSLSNLFDALELDYDSGDFSCTSIGGLASEQLERMPQEGDRFLCRRLDCTVEKVEERRVAQVRIRLLPAEEEDR